MKVPTQDESAVALNPTPVNPKTAATLGGEVVDLGAGIEGIGETLEKAQIMRQKLMASDTIAKQRINNYKLASTDPDVDTVIQRISDLNDKSIDQAASTIKDPTERDKWAEEQRVQLDRQMIPIQNIVARRTSQDIKGLFNNNVSNSIQELENSADPGERQLIKNQMYKLADDVKDPYLHAGWAKYRVDTAIRHSEISQIDKDSSIPGMAEAVAKQLQDPNGMYKDIPKPIRDQKFKQVTDMIKKNGSEDKMIFAVAQNNSEGKILQKFSDNSLTIPDIVDARAGKYGAPITKEFAKAAMSAMQEPFPELASSDVYNQLAQEVATTTDPLSTKIKVLESQALSPKQKSDLLNPINETTQNLDNLIKNGFAKNRQAILEEQNNISKAMAWKQNGVVKALDLFHWYANGQDKKIADMTQDLTDKMAQQEKTKAVTDIGEGKDSPYKIAQQIINKQMLTDHPQIASFPKEGVVKTDKYGNKIRFFPNGDFNIEGVD